MGSENTDYGRLAEACDRDSSAWRQIDLLYRPLIVTWCRQRGLSLQACEDIAQDVFHTMVNKLHQYRPDGRVGSFRAWLWTVTRSRLIDYARREDDHAVGRGGSTALKSLHELEAEPNSPSEGLSTASGTHEKQFVLRALRIIRSEFEERTWDAFWRSAIDQVPTSLVAEELGVQPATVRQARSRILRRLRAIIGD